MFRSAQILGSLIGLAIGIALVVGTAILFKIPFNSGF